MKILTLTLNPAFDMHCHSAHFEPFRENFAYVDSHQPGGKGVNISRALTACGVRNHALLVLGEENSSSFLRQVSMQLDRSTVLTVPGRIRENLTLHSDGGKETRISFGGFQANDALAAQLRNTLMELADEDTIMTVTGRNTDGLALETIKELLRSVQRRGTKLVIDSRSFGLKDLRELKPWLIKPNQEEISQYLGREISSFEEVLEAAQQLHGDGIDNVMISLGADGALLVCDEGAFTAVPPAVPVISTIGAGDSAVAGFLTAAEAPAEERLALAVAFGSAACMTEGSLPPLPRKIREILSQIKLTRLA